METDISRLNDNIGSNMFDPVPLEQDEYPQQQQQPPQYQQYDQSYFQPPQTPFVEKKTDFFADIDKKTWVFILIALILGFFMGKTMQIQPILLRSV